MVAGAAQRAPLPGPQQQRPPGQSHSVWLLHVLHHDHPAAGGRHDACSMLLVVFLIFLKSPIACLLLPRPLLNFLTIFSSLSSSRRPSLFSLSSSPPLQILIPISLYVSIELVKIGQIFFITNDIDLYDERSDSRIQCKTLNVTEDLGQIEYIFSDKTGTLTENKMVFRRCSIMGTEYPHKENGNPSHCACIY